MHLYQLSHELELLNSAIDAAGGEITPEIEERLKAVEIQAAANADDVAAWIRSLKSLAEAEKGEASHFQKRRTAHETLAYRLSVAMLSVMHGLGVPKLRGRFTLTARQASTPSIRWVGEGEIPEPYRRVIVELDGTKAREAWKAGHLPDGFEVSFSPWLDIR